MLISMIAAMAHNRVIGADNAMPWHLPADLKHFKQTTLGKPVIMGRKTYESIGKALPGRQNIVVSRDESYTLGDADVVHSCEGALERVGEVDEVMIIGGGMLYQHFLPMTQRLYLTEIDLQVAGDTFFPDYAQHGSWQELAREAHDPDERNAYPYTFITLQRA